MTTQLQAIYGMWILPAGLILVWVLFRLHNFILARQVTKLLRERADLETRLTDVQMERQFWKDAND